MFGINENFTASKKLASDFFKAGTINFENAWEFDKCHTNDIRSLTFFLPDKQGGNKSKE